MPGRIVVDGLCPSSSSGGIDGVQDGCVCHQFFDGEPGHDMERALLTPGTATLHGLPLLWRKDLGSGVMVSAGAQEFTAKTEGLRAVAVSQESEVTDFDEARRQDVEKEAADEF